MKATFFEDCLDADADLSRDWSRSHPWWLYANLCSLDAPIVAVVWLFAFSRAFDSPVSFSVYVVLFLAIWSIYVADRLLDGLRQKNWRLATQRHQFVRRHQKHFIGMLLVSLPLAAVITLLTLPVDLIAAGLLLCLVVVFYFTAFVRLFPQLKPLLAKEFACGFVFAIGTTLGIDAVRYGIFTHPTRVLPAVLLFAALCIFNCLIIAARERLTDQVNDSAAASTWWTHLDRDLMIFGAALMVLSGISWGLSSLPYVYPACFISTLALVLVHFPQSRFSDSMSRVLVDVVLLSPLLLMI